MLRKFTSHLLKINQLTTHATVVYQSTHDTPYMVKIVNTKKSKHVPLW